MLLKGAMPVPLHIINIGSLWIGILKAELETVNLRDFGLDLKKLLVTPFGTIETQSSIC